MIQLYQTFSILFVLTLSIFQLPQVFARDTPLETIQRLDPLPPEIQLKVLWGLMPPVRERLYENLQKMFFKELKEQRVVKEPDDWIHSVCFSPDSSKIASGSDDGKIQIWDAKTGKLIQTLSGHTNSICAVHFSPDGLRLASASMDWTARIWDLQTEKNIHVLREHHGLVYSVCFSPDGLTLASGSFDKTIRIWNAKTGEKINTLTGQNDWIYSVHFSPDGSKIASGSLISKKIRIQNVKTGQVIHHLTGHHPPAFSVCFSPDGSKLSAGSNNNTIPIWDVQTGKLTHTLNVHPSVTRSVRFSPNSSKFASNLDFKTIRIWDTKTWEPLHTLMGHLWGVRSIDFSPDGSKIATASLGTIRIWDLHAKEKLIKEIDNLGPAQILLLYVLYQNQKGLELGKTISLIQIEKTLKQKYEKKGEQMPSLLNLRESYNTLSPGLQHLVNKTFNQSAKELPHFYEK